MHDMLCGISMQILAETSEKTSEKEGPTSAAHEGGDGDEHGAHRHAKALALVRVGSVLHVSIRRATRRWTSAGDNRLS